LKILFCYLVERKKELPREMETNNKIFGGIIYPKVQLREKPFRGALKIASNSDADWVLGSDFAQTVGRVLTCVQLQLEESI
jgi:hypothetical protein